MASQGHKLSVFDAAVVVVGIVFGSGIFVAPQIVAAFCGSTALSLLAWPAGALIAVCGSLCYAECISRVRAEGGFYSVFRYTFGEAFASTAGIISQIVVSPAALAGPVTIGGSALGVLLFGHNRHALGCTFALLALAALLNINGVRFSKTAQRLFVGAKVSLVAMLLLACLLAHVDAPMASEAVQHLPTGDGGPKLMALLASFFGILLWTFDGWTDVTLISSRLAHPGRDLSRALMLGLFGLALIFMAVQGAVMSILGAAQTAASDQPFAAAIAAVFGTKSRLWVDSAIVLSTFTSAHGVMWMVSTLTRVMSESGTLPRVIAKRDVTLGRPVCSVLFVAGLASLACLLDDFSTIVALFSFFIWVFYGLMAVSLMKLRRAKTADAQTWVAPGGLVPPVIVGLVSILMTLSHVASFPKGCCAAVVLFGALWTTRAWRHEGVLKPAE